MNRKNLTIIVVSYTLIRLLLYILFPSHSLGVILIDICVISLFWFLDKKIKDT